MSKPWALVLLLACISAYLLAQVRTTAPTTPPHPGRYQIFFSPNVRADTFLVDTDTGKIWHQVVYTDLRDQPGVWEPMDKVDNPGELYDWMTKHPLAPTPTPTR